MYAFDYYKEKYLKDHYKIGNYHLSQWLGAQQTDVSELQKAYSNPGFDPKSKFYALFEDNVIGFITSGISEKDGIKTANMEMPLVIEGHERAIDGLFEFALSTFKDNNVDRIATRASPQWGKTIDLVQKFGFEFDELLWKSSRLNISDFPHELISHDKIVSIVGKKDYNQIKKILMTNRKMSEDQAQDQISLLEKISERVLSWIIVKREDKIVAYDHLVKDVRDPTKARMNSIYYKDEKSKDAIMRAHVQAAKSNKVNFIDNFFFGSTLEDSVQYKKYGFAISDVSSYVRKII